MPAPLTGDSIVLDSEAKVTQPRRTIVPFTSATSSSAPVPVVRQSSNPPLLPGAGAVGTKETTVRLLGSSVPATQVPRLSIPAAAGTSGVSAKSGSFPATDAGKKLLAVPADSSAPAGTSTGSVAVLKGGISRVVMPATYTAASGSAPSGFSAPAPPGAPGVVQAGAPMRSIVSTTAPRMLTTSAAVPQSQGGTPQNQNTSATPASGGGSPASQVSSQLGSPAAAQLAAAQNQYIMATTGVPRSISFSSQAGSSRLDVRGGDLGLPTSTEGFKWGGKSGWWLTEFGRRFWPSLADFIGTKIKDALNGMNIDVNNSIDTAVLSLSDLPPPLPPTKEWLNGLLAIAWPLLSRAVRKLVKTKVLPGIQAKLPSFLKGLDIDPCDLGTRPPEVKDITVTQDNTAGGWIELKIDFEYMGDADIDLLYKSIRVGVHSISLKGQLYLSFHGLLPRPPFFEGLSIFFAKPLNFKLHWKGLVTSMFDLDDLESIIKKVLDEQLGQLMVLPNRIAVPICTDANVSAMSRPKPRGMLAVYLMEAEKLVGIEHGVETLITGNLTADPYVVIHLGAENWRSSTCSKTLNPEWDESENLHLFLVELPGEETMEIHVYDDGFWQSLKKNIAPERESDELARCVGLTVPELLGRSPSDPLLEEIENEKWFDLVSWWPGKGLSHDHEDFHGPDHEGFEASEGPPNKGKILGKKVGAKVEEWAGNKLEYRKEKAERERDRLLQQNARIKLRCEWRPIDDAGDAKPLPKAWVDSKDGKGGKLPTVLKKVPEEKTAAPASKFYMKPDEDDQDDDDDHWPSYILRVGILKLEQAPFEENASKLFYVRGDVYPALNFEGKEIVDGQDGKSRQVTKLRRPRSRNINMGKTKGEDNDVSARKAAILLEHYVPLDDIMEVLDIDKKTLNRALSYAICEKSSRRDVFFNQMWVFLIKDPEKVILKLGVLSSNKKHETKLGDQELHIGSLMYRNGFDEVLQRMQLQEDDQDADTCMHLTVTVHLWPVVKKSRLWQPSLLSTSQRPEMKHRILHFHLWIYKAEGLRCVDMFSQSDPFVVVQAVKQKKQKRKTREICQTPYISDDPDPVWDYENKHDGTLKEDEDLLFEVYDMDEVFSRRGKKLGEATIKHNKCAKGIYTELDLGDGNGTLQVKVLPAVHGKTTVDVPFTEEQGKPKIRVWIRSAKGLKHHNHFGGKNDPFVICKLSDEKQFRTESIHEESNPTWDHPPQVLTIGGETELNFDVRDKDMVGSTDLGSASLTIAQCKQGFDGDLPLGPGLGTLSVKVQAVHPGLDPPNLNLEVTVVKAEGLPRADWTGSSDPYCICKTRAKEIFRTDVVWKNLNPVWNHGPNMLKLITGNPLKFEVWDKDIGRPDELLGIGSLTYQDVEKGFSGDISLGAGKGRLHLRIKAVNSGQAKDFMKRMATQKMQQEERKKEESCFRGCFSMFSRPSSAKPAVSDAKD